MIQLSNQQGCMLQVIARSVHSVPTSIGQELKRNGWGDQVAAPGKRKSSGSRPHQARLGRNGAFRA